MADLDMCQNDDCPLQERCYRHEARISELWQAWAPNTPYEVDGETRCDGYLSMETRQPVWAKR